MNRDDFERWAYDDGAGLIHFMEKLDSISRNATMKKQHADRLLKESGYEFDERDRLFDRLWGQVSEVTLLDRFRARMICRYLDRALTLSGDVIECGAFRGGISLLMALWLREAKSAKRVFICDSFRGLAAPERKLDRGYQEGLFAADPTELKEKIHELGVEAVCVIKEGWFKDTFPSFDSHQRFCLAHIDCDLWEPAAECLRFLYPRVSDGVPMIFDDYCDGSRGVMIAVNDWVSKHGEILHFGPTPQVTFVKGMRSESAGVNVRTVGFEGTRFSVSFDHLRNLTCYGWFLRALAEHERQSAMAIDVFHDVVTEVC